MLADLAFNSIKLLFHSFLCEIKVWCPHQGRSWQSLRWGALVCRCYSKSLLLIWSLLQIGAAKQGGWGGVKRLTVGKLQTHFFQMCSMSSCVNADLLKAKCKSWDALRSASTSQTVKAIDGSRCQRNELSKHPLSISKHRKIQALQPAEPFRFRDTWLLKRVNSEATGRLENV